MAENKYKCIAYLKCERCGHEFNALLTADLPPDGIGTLDGSPAKIGEPLYSFYNLACAKCGEVVTAAINEAEIWQGLRLSATCPDGSKIEDAPIYLHVRPLASDTFVY